MSKYIDIQQAAERCGRQTNDIQDFIYRGKLKPYFDRREVAELSREISCKSVNGQLGQRQKRRRN